MTSAGVAFGGAYGTGFLLGFANVPGNNDDALMWTNDQGHALTDGRGRPITFLLIGCQVADCRAGEVLLDEIPDTPILHADKGYDGDAIRIKVEARGTMPNIPPKANRRWKNCFSPHLYRANVRKAQGLPTHRNPIRPSGKQLPRSRLSCGYRQLLVMSPEPSIRRTFLLPS